MNNNLLQSTCQTWFDDYNRVTISQDLCQQSISRYYILVMTIIPLLEGLRAHLIIPECQRRIADASVVAEQPDYQRINKNILYTQELPDKATYGVFIKHCVHLITTN